MIFAWIAAKLSGVTASAITAAASISVLIAGIVGGIAWIRHDAAQSERAAWEIKLANAQVEASKLLADRERQAQDSAASDAAKRAAAALANQQQIGELTAGLAGKPRIVCYPKDIIGRMNE